MHALRRRTFTGKVKMLRGECRCVYRGIFLLCQVYIWREQLTFNTYLAVKCVINSRTTHAETVYERLVVKSHVITHGHVPANKHDQV